MTAAVAVVALLVPVVLALVVLALVVLAWRRERLRVRLVEARDRTTRTWAALDRALVRRAERSLSVAAAGGTDPATSLLVADAAGAALEPGLDRADRERAESDLTAVIDLTGLPTVEVESEQVVLGRRLHNDAVLRGRVLHARRAVRVLRLAAHPPDAEPFEMAEPRLVCRS